MKIYVHNFEIFSLENVVRVEPYDKKTLRLYHSESYTDWTPINYKNSEELQEGVKEIAKILSTPTEPNDIIIFGELCFRKSEFVSANPSTNILSVVLGGKGSGLHEVKIYFSSEKKCKEGYNKIIDLIK